jgi:Rho-binding antiterminator
MLRPWLDAPHAQHDVLSLAEYSQGLNKTLLHMASDYKPIDCNFYDELEAVATLKKRVLLQYFSELRELTIESVLIDTFFVRDGAEFMRLKTGEEIRLDLIIRIDDKLSPTYAGYPDFSCGC